MFDIVATVVYFANLSTSQQSPRKRDFVHCTYNIVQHKKLNSGSVQWIYREGRKQKRKWKKKGCRKRRWNVGRKAMQGNGSDPHMEIECFI